eukprot:g51835.t1
MGLEMDFLYMFWSPIQFRLLRLSKKKPILFLTCPFCRHSLGISGTQPSLNGEFCLNFGSPKKNAPTYATDARKFAGGQCFSFLNWHYVELILERDADQGRSCPSLDACHQACLWLWCSLHTERGFQCTLDGLSWYTFALILLWTV